MKNKDELYYCFRYHCNYCPKASECEERGDSNDKSRKINNTYIRVSKKKKKKVCRSKI